MFKSIIFRITSLSITIVTIITIIAHISTWTMITSVAIVTVITIIFSVLLHIKVAEIVSNHFLWFCLLFHINQFKGLSIIFKTFFFIKNVTVSWICWLSDETWLVWHNAPKVKTPCPFKSMIKS